MTEDPAAAALILEHVVRVRHVAALHREIRAELAAYGEDCRETGNGRGHAGRGTQQHLAETFRRRRHEERNQRCCEGDEREVELEAEHEPEHGAGPDPSLAQPEPPDDRDERERSDHRVADRVPRPRQQERVDEKAGRSDEPACPRSPKERRRPDRADREPQAVEGGEPLPADRLDRQSAGVEEQRVLVVEDVAVQTVAREQPTDDAEEDARVGVRRRRRAEKDEQRTVGEPGRHDRRCRDEQPPHQASLRAA